MFSHPSAYNNRPPFMQVWPMGPLLHNPRSGHVFRGVLHLFDRQPVGDLCQGVPQVLWEDQPPQLQLPPHKLDDLHPGGFGKLLN